MTIDIFTLGLAFILIHEMDAIRCSEWRIFPATSFMNDKLGMTVFVFLHIPLFYILFLPDVLDNHSFRYGFSIFLIVHFFLHILLLRHKKNEFRDWISWSLIAGSGICGALYII
ncbi:MAG: DUF6713 family protein [Bacteroidota bacterium]